MSEAAALAAAGPGAACSARGWCSAPSPARIAVGGGAAMTVHFIGAGPGAADLITVRGARPASRAARSVSMPARSCRRSCSHYCPAGARIVDTAPMSLDEIEAEFVAAHRAGHDVARLHSGDLSVWSAVAEQIRRLERTASPTR